MSHTHSGQPLAARGRWRPGNRLRRGLQAPLAIAGLLAVAPLAQGSEAERYLDRDLATGRLEGLRLDAPVSVGGIDRIQLQSKLHPSLIGAAGEQQVVVRLKGPSVGKLEAKDRSSRMGHKYRLEAEQADFIQRHPGKARVKAQTQMVLNAVFADVDAADLAELAADPAVERIAPVANYQLHLSETVPYIGADTVQNTLGFDGSGVSVAVLDSGIDYTHAGLGGGGTLADYAAAYGTGPSDPANTTTDGLFPTAKVVDGFDFVGEAWPNGPLAPDPDPIDFEGHGTHVADIIGGTAGVAPGADLYAVKVCSAVSSSCSGTALIQGMEFSVDPNGDGDPSDRVDIINMSLGADYGQPFDDDLSAAVEAATALGVLTVSSAGNGGDKPYITGTPSSAPSALAVAQTQVPSATLQNIRVLGTDYPAVFQPWSVPLTTVIGGPLQYGDGAGGNLNGCAPFAPGSLAGQVVLVDRGACNFTLKISNISQAGGAVGIIGLVAPGAPFSGGDGGDRPIDIPGYMISQADSNAFKAAVGTTALLDPGNQLALVGQMVGSSSRGPQHEVTHLIKPEIGAPGASVSAEVGTGTGTTPFGGTSGASPMVAGSAALLLQAGPGLSPAEAKALLMNTGETDIDTDPFTGLAPITRIGGGEVRVDRAVTSSVAAWDDATLQGGLSFGFIDAAKATTVLHKKVRVRNYSDQAVELSVTPTFRYPDDAESGAVEVQAPKKVKVRPRSDAVLPVKMTVHGELLSGNFMNSGSDAANPAALTANEYDGYFQLTGPGVHVHLPWHVLPRQAANVVGRQTLTFSGGLDQVSLNNNGAGTAQIDAYALLAVSPNLPAGGLGEQSPTPDLRAVGINTFPVPAGFCSGQASFIWAFAINTWERQQHLLPVSHQVWLDIDRDGTDDYVVLNRDLSGFTTISDGRQVTYAVDLATGSASAFFFTEHSTNTGNTVFYVCGEQVGLTGSDMLATTVDMYVIAQDFYYGGPGDVIDGLSVTPLGERYFGIPEDIPAGAGGSLQVLDFGPFPGNSDELGVMLITNGDRGAGARGGATQGTEAFLLLNK